MLTRHFVRGLAALSLAATTLVSQVASAATIYLKADPLTGESTAPGHANEIEVTSVQFSITNSLHGAPVGNQSAGRPVFGEFQFTKLADKSSPLWFSYMAQNTRIPQVIVSFVKPGPAASSGQTFFKITLTNATVSEYVVDATDAASAKETVGLSYQKITITYAQQSASGSLGPAQSAGWDVVSNGRI
jgi:type VI secretion system secreted protein Hcp